VVEDIGGAAGDPSLRAVARLKTLVDDVFCWPRDRRAHWTTLHAFGPEAGWLARHITGVAFYRSIVFVMRGKNPGDNPHLPLDEETIRREGLAPLA
jgi:hypothetical protein